MYKHNQKREGWAEKKLLGATLRYKIAITRLCSRHHRRGSEIPVVYVNLHLKDFQIRRAMYN